MSKNSIIKKSFMNKRTKQFSVVIPKKEIKAIDPSIKSSKDFTVKIQIIRSRRIKK